MIAASFCCREVQLSLLKTSGRKVVPRCLFGPPNPMDTIELLKEALDQERARFIKRWGIDPCSEDNKENAFLTKRYDTSPKKRTSPYSRQTNMHDYWRSRKVCDAHKKPLAQMESPKQQSMEVVKVTKSPTSSSSSSPSSPSSNRMIRMSSSPPEKH